MNKILIFLFSLFISNSSNQIIAQDKYDNFPLSKNLHYSYYFHEESLVKEFFQITHHSIDSGNVNLIIRDSSLLNETTKIWNVEQRLNIQHTQLIGDHDTIYMILDTSYFSLYESLIENHEIRCTSKVWTFPIISSNSRIFRYLNSTNVLLVYSNDNPFGETWNDSLWFAEGLGMDKRKFNSCVATISTFTHDLIIKLLEKPITPIKNYVSFENHFKLSNNFPNPFNLTTRIMYTIGKPSFVILKIYDTLGREIEYPVNGFHESGTYEIEFGKKDPNLSSGVYFYRLEADNYKESKKMILLK